MSNTGKLAFDRFKINLDLALFILIIATLIELVFYRFLANMGFYVGVGATGVRAGVASVSIFSMLLSGALSAILLFWAVARIVNHPNFSGVWWRGVLIFVSPLFLLSMFWSVWTPLTNWLLVASLIAVEFTVLLVCVISIIRPVSFGIKRLFAAVAIIMLIATAKWIALDFFQVSRLEKWGSFLLNAFEVAQFFMMILPIGAFVLFIAGTRQKLLENLRRPHFAALVFSTLAAVLVFASVVLIQRLTSDGDLVEAGQYVMRVFYRTIGLKMGWPLAPVMTAISVFCLGLTTLMLVMGSRHRKRTPGDRDIGLGLALVYLAGIQPFTVYQLSISLLGVLLLAIGVADRHPKAERGQSLRELHNELDNELDNESGNQRGDESGDELAG